MHLNNSSWIVDNTGAVFVTPAWEGIQIAQNQNNTLILTHFPESEASRMKIHSALFCHCTCTLRVWCLCWKQTCLHYRHFTWNKSDSSCEPQWSLNHCTWRISLHFILQRDHFMQPSINNFALFQVRGKSPKLLNCLQTHPMVMWYKAEHQDCHFVFSYRRKPLNQCFPP